MSTDRVYAELLEAVYATPPGPEHDELVEQLHARYLEVVAFAATSGGLPYPAPTDPIAAGADAIRTLAQALDTQGTYTPAMGTVTLGNGSLTGRTWLVGVRMHAEVNLTFGSTTALAGSPVLISLPATPNVPTNNPIGIWTAFDSSANSVRTGNMLRSGASGVVRNADGTSLSGTTPWTWATGDQILASFNYPIANP